MSKKCIFGIKPLDASVNQLEAFSEYRDRVTDWFQAMGCEKAMGWYIHYSVQITAVLCESRCERIIYF